MTQPRFKARWTQQEDEVLLRYVRAYPHNLAKCFTMVSEQLTDTYATTGEGAPRTPSSVAGHWYSVLSKNPNALCFFTASSKHVSKNRKNGKGVETKSSIWKRFLTILKSI